MPKKMLNLSHVLQESQELRTERVYLSCLFFPFIPVPLSESRTSCTLVIIVIDTTTIQPKKNKLVLNFKLSVVVTSLLLYFMVSDPVFISLYSNGIRKLALLHPIKTHSLVIHLL